MYFSLPAILYGASLISLSFRMNRMLVFLVSAFGNVLAHKRAYEKSLTIAPFTALPNGRASLLQKF